MAQVSWRTVQFKKSCCRSAKLEQAGFLINKQLSIHPENTARANTCLKVTNMSTRIVRIA